MRRAQHAGLAVHLHRGDGADVRAIQLVLHVRDAAAGGDIAGLTPPRGAAFPAGQADQPPQHLGAARIVEIPQPERDGIDLDGGRQLVHERLVGERVTPQDTRAPEFPAGRKSEFGPSFSVTSESIVSREPVPSAPTSRFAKSPAWGPSGLAKP